MRRKILSISAALIAALGIIFIGIPNAKADLFDEFAITENTGWCTTANIAALDGELDYLYTCADNATQEWSLVTHSTNEYFLKFHVLNSNTGQDMCMQGGSNLSDRFFIEPCDAGNNNQLFSKYTMPDGNTGWQNVGTSFWINLDGNVLADYRDITNWTFVNNAPYEEWVFLGT
jgi:hypothetical protein